MTEDKNLIEANKELKALIESRKVEIGYEIGFPIYRILPDEVELAMKVLKRHGMTITIMLKPKMTG